jgi:hypothetical protein
MSEQNTSQNTPSKNMLRMTTFVLLGGVLGIVIMLLGVLFGSPFPNYESLVLVFIILGGFAVFTFLIISLMKM